MNPPTDFTSTLDEELASHCFYPYHSKNNTCMQCDATKQQILTAVQTLCNQIIGEDEEQDRIFGPGMPSFQRDLLRREQRKVLKAALQREGK